MLNRPQPPLMVQAARQGGHRALSDLDWLSTDWWKGHDRRASKGRR